MCCEKNGACRYGKSKSVVICSQRCETAAVSERAPPRGQSFGYPCLGGREDWIFFAAGNHSYLGVHFFMKITATTTSSGGLNWPL